MKGLIIDQNTGSCDIFPKILRSIYAVEKEYNWLITYPECYPRNPEYSEIFKKKTLG